MASGALSAARLVKVQESLWHHPLTFDLEFSGNRPAPFAARETAWLLRLWWPLTQASLTPREVGSWGAWRPCLGLPGTRRAQAQRRASSD